MPASLVDELAAERVGVPGKVTVEEVLDLAPVLRREVYTNRVSLNADGRWLSIGDANFGFEDTIAAENGGTGATPLIEWENQGIPFQAGDRLTRLEVRARANNADVSDIELYVVYTHPDAETRWETGFDNDGEVLSVLVYNDLYLGRAANPITAVINDRSRQVIPLDFTCPTTGEIRVFVRPTGTLAAARNGYLQTIWDWEEA